MTLDDQNARRHLTAMVVVFSSTRSGGVEPVRRGLFPAGPVGDRSAHGGGADALLCVTGVHRLARDLYRPRPGHCCCRFDRTGSGAEQTSSSSASSSAQNDNSTTQSATATQSGGDGGGGQSQTIVQDAPTQQTATASATSTQSATNVAPAATRRSTTCFRGRVCDQREPHRPEQHAAAGRWQCSTDGSSVRPVADLEPERAGHSGRERRGDLHPGGSNECERRDPDR